MRLLFLKECKKMLWKPSAALLMLGIMFLSLVVMPDNSSAKIPAISPDGKVIEGRQLEQEIRKIKSSYAGTINQSKIKQLEKEWEEEEQKSLFLLADENKMKQTYGTDWKKQFEANKDAYRMILSDAEEKLLEEGDRPFYIAQARASGTPKSLVLSEVVNYGRIWYPVAFEEGLQDFLLKDTQYPLSRRMNEKEQAILKQKLDEVHPLYYDDDAGWDILISSLANSRFFLGILILYLTSRSFNEDHANKTIGIIKSSTYGKKKLVFAKLAAITCTSIAVILLYAALMTLAVFLQYGLGNWNVNLSIMIHSVTPYTFKDAYLGGIILLLCGSLMISFLSAAISAFFKKGYVSFAIGLVLFVIPSILSIDYAKLCPISFMDFSGTYLYTDMISFLGNYYLLPPIIYTITIVIFLFCSFALINYDHTYHFIQE